MTYDPSDDETYPRPGKDETFTAFLERVATELYGLKPDPTRKRTWQERQKEPAFEDRLDELFRDAPAHREPGQEG